MEKLIKTLEKLQTLLKKKSMSFKAGQNLSSPNSPSVKTPKAPSASQPEPVKAISSKKDPVKVAEQIQDTKIKDQVKKEALNISKQGQWSIKKDEDDLDAKIRAKLKAEMDKRKFGEADAIRHKIDVDRGEKQPKTPKKPTIN